MLKSSPSTVIRQTHIQPSNSGITAYEKDQWVEMTWNSFKFVAMVLWRSCKPIARRLPTLTKLLRTRLAFQNFDCTHVTWETLLEPSAWEFFVHHEFKARGVKDFEVVLVPIKKTKTAVIDSRMAHAAPS